MAWGREDGGMALKEPTALPPTKAEANEAMDRIYQRRLRADDKDVHLFSQTHADTVAYVRLHRRVTYSVLVDDAQDVLTIIRYMQYQLECDQLTMIDICRKVRRPGPPRVFWVTWIKLAPLLGVTTAQAAYQRAKSNRAMKKRVAERDRYAGRHPNVVWREDRGRSLLEGGDRSVVAVAGALLHHREELSVNEDAADFLEDISLALDDVEREGATAKLQKSLLAYFSLLARALPEELELSSDASGCLVRAVELEAAHTAAITTTGE
jgi:hypothetical protein